MIEAEALLRWAVESNPQFVEARVVLSSLLEQNGDLIAAAAELEQALRARPNYAGALSNYADLLLKLERLQTRNRHYGEQWPSTRTISI